MHIRIIIQLKRNFNIFNDFGYFNLKPEIYLPFTYSLALYKSELKLNFRYRGTKMNLKPLHDRVLVERVEQEDRTKGGIIIPDTAQEKPMEGKVVSVGGGARNENGQVVALDVKKGDRICLVNGLVQK